MLETFPMDFTGAAKSDGEPAIICISSDEEEMEILSSYSADDLYLSSEDETEEVRLMARCIERQLTEPIPISSTSASFRRKDLWHPDPMCRLFPLFERYISIWQEEMGL